MKAQYGFALHFGAGYKGHIPKGWSLNENPDDWTILTDDKGQEHLAADDCAYPYLVSDGTCGLLTKGQRFIDTQNSVTFT